MGDGARDGGKVITGTFLLRANGKGDTSQSATEPAGDGDWATLSCSASCGFPMEGHDSGGGKRSGLPQSPAVAMESAGVGDVGAVWLVEGPMAFESGFCVSGNEGTAFWTVIDSVPVSCILTGCEVSHAMFNGEILPDNVKGTAGTETASLRAAMTEIGDSGGEEFGIKSGVGGQGVGVRDRRRTCDAVGASMPVGMVNIEEGRVWSLAADSGMCTVMEGRDGPAMGGV